MKYDESFDPPAPIAEIVLRNAQTGAQSAKIKMLLDTGADISLLPLKIIEQTKIEAANETINLFGFDENQTVAEIYHLQIIFLGKKISGNYCAVNDETGILGRDVLNEFSILFNGKKLEWTKQS
jgi:predicted aspartyl protease